MKQSDRILNKIISYYSRFDEKTRLSASLGQVEFLRTQDLIDRFLKSPPAVVLDVGGAAGPYACWLANDGYEVHLIDPVPLHVELARKASDALPGAFLASCRMGDARELDFSEASADAVLLLGALYHLVKARDRERALSEAYRVLKKGGCLFAAGISRFASTIDGLVSGYYQDPAFRKIMHRDLKDGRHRNPTGNPDYFMSTYFHHAEELKTEVSQAGFEVKGLYAVEGISWAMKDFDEKWKDDFYREFLLEIIEKTEQESSLIGASPHIMCVGMKS